ncbi:MAG TPA: hypothetical protein VF768_10060, partial [Holophagaceae bacterium]
QSEARLASARATLDAQRAALTAVEARLAIARQSLKLGGSDRGEWIAAELEALQGRSLVLTAWAEVQRARLAVEDAFQKPLDPHEQPYPFDLPSGARP